MSSRILLVDDDANTREVLAMLLSAQGHDVASCEGPTEALAELRAQPFNLLLTDYVMPVMNGLELTRAARALQPTIRCFVITGKLRPATLDLGRVTWFDKPLDFDALVHALRS